MPFYFGWDDRKINIIHSRLRNMCSSLNADLHLVNLGLELGLGLGIGLELGLGLGLGLGCLTPLSRIRHID